MKTNFRKYIYIQANFEKCILQKVDTAHTTRNVILNLRLVYSAQYALAKLA